MDDDALYAAAIAGDADAISKLETKADTVNEYGETILHIESRMGNTERVRFILRQFESKNLLIKLGFQKETALAWAAYYGYTEVVELLIDAARHLPPSSANNNPVSSFQDFLRHADQDSETALNIAAREGHTDIVKLLVEADPSDRHIQNNEGKTPIYIAAERGYIDIVKLIWTTCTALPNLDGPGGSTTVLHVAIKNLDQAKEEDKDVIHIIINAAKKEDKNLVQLFKRTDENRCTILELAVERNHVDVVKLILAENKAYKSRGAPDFIGLMPLIYRAIDKEYTDIVDLLAERYKDGAEITFLYGGMAALISAIRSRERESVCSLLDRFGKEVVTFADNLGWTALHHAAYHEFDAIIYPLIEAQKKFEHQFFYEDMVSTPFHVAAEKGYTSTVKLLMLLWPSTSSAYTAVDKKGRNILHLAALQSKKEMIQDILNYCPEKHKNDLVNKPDNSGNTPLHVLIRRGCFVPELMKYKGLDIAKKNKKKWTPPDMLYFEDQIIDDQVQIKIALDDVQTNQSAWNLLAESTEKKMDIWESIVPPSKRMKKDVIFNKEAKLMMHEKYARMKEDTHAIANCFVDAIAGDAISKAALKMKADTLNESGETILHIESKKGDTENVRFIVSEFANKSLLGKLDSLKQTALNLAACHGHTEVVEVLIDAARHLPPSSANDDAHNSVSSFQEFIRQANVPMGNTALHLAVLNGNVSIVKLLVEADPNDSHVQNNEGKTPIYIAAENGYKDIVKEICTTCTADLSLDGPGGSTTALHALIQNIGQVTEGTNDVIRMMVNAAKRWSSAKDALDFEALFSRTDQSGRTVLQLAVERNYVDAVKMILLEDPAYQHGREIKRNGLMRLICKAIDNEYSDDIVKLLSVTYEAGISPDH